MTEQPVRRTTQLGGPALNIREAFFSAFSETVGAVGIPHKAIASKAGVGLSSISCYKGVRVPEEPGPLERIYKVLEEEACARKLVLPHSLPHLLALRTAATVEKTDPDAAAQVLASLLRQPASEACLRSRRRRLLHARRKAARLPALNKVPVPPRTGDRHPATDRHAADIADYLRHVAEGRFRHAQFIAWRWAISPPRPGAATRTKRSTRPRARGGPKRRPLPPRAAFLPGGSGALSARRRGAPIFISWSRRPLC
ncbi:hypothetical protein SALBM135S_06910 [Streptomyces alboniger]